MPTSKQIDKLTWVTALARRYAHLPATRTTFRDSRYHTVERAETVQLYRQFLSWMEAILGPYGAYKWTWSKGDCDFWSRLFIAYVLLRNAMGHSALKPALAEIHFLTDPANPRSGHSVCSLMAADKTLYELDPQPDGGLFDLTDEQAATVRSLDA